MQQLVRDAIEELLPSHALLAAKAAEKSEREILMQLAQALRQEDE
jgi:hypothetical protein